MERLVDSGNAVTEQQEHCLVSREPCYVIFWST